MRTVDLWSKVRCASGMPSFSIGDRIFDGFFSALESKLSRLARLLFKKKWQIIWHFARLAVPLHPVNQTEH